MRRKREGIIKVYKGYLGEVMGRGIQVLTTTPAKRFGKGKLLTVIESLLGEDESEDPVCNMMMFEADESLVAEAL